MDFGLATYGLGYLAGLLSTLSPCVLPLLPILLASALAAHRFGALALALGLMLSFAIIGLGLAAAGDSLGLDPDLSRGLAAVLLCVFGAMLLSSRLQTRFSAATSGVANFGEQRLARFRLDGWPGQLATGLVLGLIWSPCVGPTLGAATTLAAQGRQLGQISLLMALFGLGASTPLLLIGLLSRATATRWRGGLLAAGQRGKTVMGALMLLVGVSVLFGADKRIEAWAVDVSPDWLTALTTRF